MATTSAGKEVPSDPGHSSFPDANGPAQVIEAQEEDPNASVVVEHAQELTKKRKTGEDGGKRSGGSGLATSKGFSIGGGGDKQGKRSKIQEKLEFATQKRDELMNNQGRMRSVEEKELILAIYYYCMKKDCERDLAELDGKEPEREKPVKSRVAEMVGMADYGKRDATISSLVSTYESTGQVSSERKQRKSSGNVLNSEQEARVHEYIDNHRSQEGAPPMTIKLLIEWIKDQFGKELSYHQAYRLNKFNANS
eukprot:CAMPEP_0197470508 /NCGR_PEP_ID=MMETSP1309-20131121/1210_1 /TAXON_ID=464262 /ORGANISM="Genus nov. species nov., Strain RCC998" /LENGTH=251 /DNA_ID=CAMNT_0043007423 /DNA_START=50 /DNA_END=805 /DNA_ORIENTATION=+